MEILDVWKWVNKQKQGVNYEEKHIGTTASRDI